MYMRGARVTFTNEMMKNSVVSFMSKQIDLTEGMIISFRARKEMIMPSVRSICFDMKLTTEFFIISFVNVTRAPRIYISSTPSRFQTEIKFHLRLVWKPKMNDWCRLALAECGILRICPNPVVQTGMLCKGTRLD